MDSVFWKMTGVPAIDDFRSRLAACLYGQEMAEQIFKGEAFETRLKANTIAAIKEQLVTHSVRGEFGFEDLRISSWEDQRALSAFMAEIERKVRAQVIMPSAGDVPTLARSSVGRLLTMFTGWSFAITNQVLLPLIESGKFVQLAKLMGYGYGCAYLSETIRGVLNGKPYDPTGKEIHTRIWRRLPTGLLGLVGENIVDAATGQINSSRELVYSLAKSGELRWALDAFDSALALSKKSQTGKPLTEWQIRRLYSVIPFANLWYINPVLNFFNGH